MKKYRVAASLMLLFFVFGCVSFAGKPAQEAQVYGVMESPIQLGGTAKEVLPLATKFCADNGFGPLVLNKAERLKIFQAVKGVGEKIGMIVQFGFSEATGEYVAFGYHIIVLADDVSQEKAMQIGKAFGEFIDNKVADGYEAWATPIGVRLVKAQHVYDVSAVDHGSAVQFAVIEFLIDPMDQGRVNV
jgi:hypothetical protein